MKLNPKTRKSLMEQAKALAHEGFIAAGYPDTNIPIQWHSGKKLACARTVYTAEETFSEDEKIYTLLSVEYCIKIHRAWSLLSEGQRKRIMFHEVAHVVNRMEGHPECGHAECFKNVLQRMGIPGEPLDADTLHKLKPYVNVAKKGRTTIKTETKIL